MLNEISVYFVSFWTVRYWHFVCVCVLVFPSLVVIFFVLHFWINLRCHIIGFICFNDSKTITITKQIGWLCTQIRQMDDARRSSPKSNNMTNCWDFIVIFLDIFDRGNFALNNIFGTCEYQIYTRYRLNMRFLLTLWTMRTISFGKWIFQTNGTKCKKEAFDVVFQTHSRPNPFYLLFSIRKRRLYSK